MLFDKFWMPTPILHFNVKFKIATCVLPRCTNISLLWMRYIVMEIVIENFQAVDELFTTYHFWFLCHLCQSKTRIISALICCANTFLECYSPVTFFTKVKASIFPVNCDIGTNIFLAVDYVLHNMSGL